MNDVMTVLHRHQHVLDAYCARFCRDPHDRDELAQLVRIRVWRGYAGFDGRAEFTTWLFRIVANTAATEFARRVRRPVPVDVAVWSGVDQLCEPGVEAAVIARDELHRALQRLDERFRQAVELVDLWGCEQEEVAQIAAVAPSTVRTRVHRGRRRLRRMLVA